MSAAIREAIASELAGERSREAVLVEDLEKVHARIQQLEDLDAQAAQLDDGEVSAAPPPSAPAPARRQAPTPAGRRSHPQRADKAHTAKGAPTGGGREAVKADDIIGDVKGAIAKLGRATPNGIAKELGYSNGSTGVDAVREAIAKLLAQGAARIDGQIRGRAAYALAIPAAPSPPPPPPLPTQVAPSTNPIDAMLERIVAALRTNGARDRDDLKDRVAEDGKGEVFEEDFRLALDRGPTLKRLGRHKDGARIVYRADA